MTFTAVFQASGGPEHFSFSSINQSTIKAKTCLFPVGLKLFIKSVRTMLSSFATGSVFCHKVCNAYV